MKKVISVILLLSTIITLLVSCQGDKAGNDSITDSNTTQIEQSDTIEPETTESVKTETVNLSDFVIVYKDFTNENVMNATSIIKDKIYKLTGITLSCKRAKVENTYEIIVGDAEREISNEYYSNLEDLISKYGYMIKDGKIFIAGVDIYTIEKSIDTFINDYITKGADQITIEENKNGLVDINLAEEKLPVAPDDGHIRFVSHNIIRMNLKYQAKAYRLDQLLALYGILDADILSLDECDEQWFTDFGFDKALEKIGFKLAPVDDLRADWSKNDNCECRILYKESKFNLIASGCELFLTEIESEGINWYGWALLEEKTTGKRLVAFSNHFTGSTQGKLKQAKQLLEYVKQIEAKGYPVVISGDFNATISDGSMQALRTHLVSARHDSEIKNNMNYSTVNEGGTSGPPKTGSAIDHVFYSNFGIKGKLYETIIGYYGYVSSDHLPIIFDFTLN